MGTQNSGPSKISGFEGFYYIIGILSLEGGFYTYLAVFSCLGCISTVVLVR